MADGVEELDVRLECGTGRVRGEGLVVAGEVGDEDEGGYVGGVGEPEGEVRDGSGTGWDIEDAVGESVVPQVKLPDRVGGGGGDSSVLRLDLASAANAAQDFGFTAVRGPERQDDEVGGIAGKKLGWDGLAVALWASCAGDARFETGDYCGHCWVADIVGWRTCKHGRFIGMRAREHGGMAGANSVYTYLRSLCRVFRRRFFSPGE